jgi:hypothetical protein
VHRLPDLLLDPKERSAKFWPRQWSLPSPPKAGKIARADDSFQRKEFFYAQTQLGEAGWYAQRGVLSVPRAQRSRRKNLLKEEIYV